MGRMLSALFHSFVVLRWGRILAATGSVPLSPSAVTGKPVAINPETVSVTIVPGDGSSALPVLVNGYVLQPSNSDLASLTFSNLRGEIGEPEQVDEVRAKEIMVQDEFEIVVDLEMGAEEARYWTCDFSYVSALLSFFPLSSFVFFIVRVFLCRVAQSKWSAEPKRSFVLHGRSNGVSFPLDLDLSLACIVD
ncbi:hypothetical protein NMY22_g2117 [Coprinellus aureogranulatus]|nr:hypothetical protein NMY22_g2117 [Coprinellus aureogranulatus]